MMTTTKSMPVCSAVTPKVKRIAPDCGSMPTVAIISPRHIESSPFSIASFEMAAVAASAKHMSMKYSGGPNLSAKRATGTATATNAIVAMRPPMNEAMAEMASAASACPEVDIG